MVIDRPAGPHVASIHVPGSKSLTCRAIVLGALAGSPVELHGALHSDDTHALLKAVHGMGIDTRIVGDIMHLASGGQRHLREKVLDMGLGGAPARFAIALASLADAPIIIDGAPRLRERPMQDAIDSLAALGVVVEPVGAGSGLPLRVTPMPWSSHSLTITDTATSQVVSAILLVAASAGGLDVHFAKSPTSEAYIRLTIESLLAWGIDVDVQECDGVLERIRVSAGTPVGGTHSIASDASSAAAAACMACAVPGAQVTLLDVQSDDGQPDAAALSLLEQAGAQLTTNSRGLHIVAREALHFPALVDASGMPDAVPVLAALAAVRGSSLVRFAGLDTLRVKECDRIEGMRVLLQLAGASAQIEGNDLLVSPMPSHGGDPIMLPTMDDHRMAMAGAVLGLWRGGVRIDDPEVVTKSWPTFWSDLAPLGGWVVS